MELETHSAPSPQPNPGPGSNHGPTAQPTETFKDSGIVRVIETLGFESDIIDCPHCSRRGPTIVDERASQSTTIARVFCCLAFWPCGCLTWFIPKMRKWYFDAYHKCSLCERDVAFVKHNQQRITARYSRSQSGVEV